MQCPDCGTPMNHHAAKLVREAPRESRVDADRAEVIALIHYCPDCGNVESIEEDSENTEVPA